MLTHQMLAMSNQVAQVLGLIVGGVLVAGFFWYMLRPTDKRKSIGGPIILLAILAVILIGVLMFAASL
jgi:hypothetical membrane protein